MSNHLVMNFVLMAEFLVQGDGILDTPPLVFRCFWHSCKSASSRLSARYEVGLYLTPSTFLSIEHFLGSFA